MSDRMPNEGLSEYARRLRTELARIDREIAAEVHERMDQYPLSAYAVDELIAEVERRMGRHDG